MKTKLLIAVAFSAAVSTTVYADDSDWEISSSATLVTQYVFRGFDISDQDLALQGGVDLEHEGGFYAGIWASTYDIVVDDGVEIDPFVGYSYQINDDFSVDIGVLEYTFTGDTDSSTELHLGATYQNVTVNYHSDRDLDVDYLEVNVDFELSEKISLGVHFGNASPDQGSSFNDYQLTLGYTFLDKVDGFIALSGSDLNDPNAESYIFGGINVAF